MSSKFTTSALAQALNHLAVASVISGSPSSSVWCFAHWLKHEARRLTWWVDENDESLGSSNGCGSHWGTYRLTGCRVKRVLTAAIHFARRATLRFSRL